MTRNARRWTMVGMLSLAAAAPATAQPGEQTASLDMLERGFWRCDYAATQGMLDSATATQCSIVSEAFKARRFGNDFAAMLAWWQSNKVAHHLSLEAEAKRLAGMSMR